MKTNLKTLFTITTCFMLLMACGSKKIQPDQETALEHAGDEHAEGTVTLTTMQRKAIDLKLGNLQQRNLTGTIRVTGQLELPPQYEADISAIMGGSITKINVIEGDKVAKGETVAMLEHPGFIQMQIDLQQNSSRLAYLKQDYLRHKDLLEKQVTSAESFQKAKADYLSTKALVEGLKAKLQMLHLNVDEILSGEIYQSIPVKSPIPGFIKSVNISIGENVAPTDLLIEVVDLSHIHADLMVFEKDALKVKKGQKVYLTVANTPELEIVATIFRVGKTFEKEPKAIHVHADIKNSTEGLILGMYIEGSIAVSSNVTLALPETAIVNEGEEAYIFVKVETAEDDEAASNSTGNNETDESWTFKKTPVSTGLESGGWVEINLFEPLPDSALIAYTGAYKLISEMNKAETGHHD